MDVLALPALAFAVFNLRRCYVNARFTTARPASAWAIAATIVCMAAVLLQVFDAPTGIVSTTQYFAAVMLLTPPVYILGARRPGVQAWPWFVVIPLLVVLQWPVFTQLPNADLDSPVLLPLPTALGFLFVLMMGAGNFFGTRRTVKMLLGSAGVCVLLLGVTEFNPEFSTIPLISGSWLVGLATVGGSRDVDAPTADGSNLSKRLSHLWKDFQDLYGLVWAKRVMDRINLFAVRENWDVRLTLHGFESTASNVTDSAETRLQQGSDEELSLRAVQMFCWLMKRFVDREFLLQYLPEDVIPNSDREDDVV